MRLLPIGCLFGVGLIASLGATAFAEEALVLHLPFDGRLGTPAEAREVDFAPGRFGRAVHVKYPHGRSSRPAGRLSYDVSKLMDPRKGTLAFWVKIAKQAGPRVPLGRVVDVRAEEDAYYHTWLRVSMKGKGDFTLQVFDVEGQAHGLNYTDGLRRWQADQWHHVALVWHCLKGVRLYDNGREIFSSWNNDHWEPQTPTLLGFGCVPGRPAQAEFWFDEARLYTEPLTAAQVAALVRGEDVRLDKRKEAFPGILTGNPGERLRVEMQGQKELPVVQLGKPVTVRQHLVKSARVRKVSRGALIDGVLRRKRPVRGPVDLRFPVVVRITDVALDGVNVASRLGQRTLTPGRTARVHLSPPLETDHLHLGARGDGPLLHEVRFFEIRRGWLGRRGERIAIPEDETQQLTVVGPAMSADTGVAAVSVELKFAASVPSVTRLELTEAAESDRSLLSVDLRLRGHGSLQATLDWPDYLLRKGGRLRFAATFDRPARIAAGSALYVRREPVDEARDAYVTRQLGWFADWYSGAAEAHRWDSGGWQPESMPELRWLYNVRAVAPANPLALAYYNRIFHHTRKVEVTIPGPAHAPGWARAQREAMKRTAAVVHWWIDHRQTDDGQFGGGWNDDVEMLHGWDLLVLGAGDEKVRRAMARLGDGIWHAGRFTHGYSNLIWDVEHAAEESTYSQPRMVVLDYGNPKWLERCMETTSNFRFWTFINPHGHRHFKGYLFQARKFRLNPETDSDVPDNARAAKIGLYVVWYNGNEQVKTWFREWADAWVDDSFKRVPGKPAGTIPGEIVADTCQIGRPGGSWKTCKRYPLGALTYHMEDQLAGTYLFTGDPKYLRPLAAQIKAGRAGEAAQVNWRRFSGDTKLDERFRGQAAKGKATAAFNAWYATGDKSFLTTACTEVVREFQRNHFLLTEAEPPTDRIPLPGNVLLREMILGGIGVWVCGWPQMTVTWERTGYDFAALVLTGTKKHVKVLAYDFGPTREVTMRVWELERGEYELRVGPDRNRDDNADAIAETRRLQVDRATRIPLRLSADTLLVIELRQLRARPAGNRPDLAVTREEVKLSPDRRAVTATIHNLGSAPAENVGVVVESKSGQTLGETKLARLSAPADLVAKTVQLTIRLAAPAPPAFRVVVDPEGLVDEITKENNTASVAGMNAARGGRSAESASCAPRRHCYALADYRRRFHW